MSLGSDTLKLTTGPSVLFISLERGSSDGPGCRLQLIADSIQLQGSSVTSVSLSSDSVGGSQAPRWLLPASRLMFRMRRWHRALSAIRRHDCIHIDLNLSSSSMLSATVLLAASAYLGKPSVLAVSSVKAEKLEGVRGVILGRVLRAANVVVVGSKEAEGRLSRFNARVKIVSTLALARRLKETDAERIQPRVALTTPVDPTILRSVVRSLALLKQKYPRAELVIAGDRCSIADMRSRLNGAAQHGVELTVTESDQQLIQALSMCDVYLETSAQADPTPALIESLSQGMPVIVIDSAGVVDSIKHGLTGLVVAAGDHVDLANRLCDLVESPELVRTLSAGAIVLGKPHDQSQVNAAWVQLYAVVAASGQRTPKRPRKISPQYQTTVKA